MSSELAAWLRRQREDRGWTRTELARQLIRAARARGDMSMPGAGNISHNIYRWERGAVGGVVSRPDASAGVAAATVRPAAVTTAAAIRTRGGRDMSLSLQGGMPALQSLPAQLHKN